jgi:uncharacterized membrane protein YfhO
MLVTSLVDDGGWTARTEAGSKLALGRANGPFLALLLAPGRHDVRLRYMAPGFRVGAAVSLAAVLGTVLVLRFRRTRASTLRAPA